MRVRLGVLLALCAGPAAAANLDVSAAYKLRAVSYTNLELNTDRKNDRSFMTNDARLGVAVRKIFLEQRGEEETTMDVGLLIHAVGVAGSSTTLNPPFDRVAAIYPVANFTPFFENAYLRVNKPLGYPVEATFGRQSFRLGSGLLLDDDGTGLTGAVLRGALPWWGMKAQGFVFQDRNPYFNAPNSLTLYGASLDLPTEGTWQLMQLFERDQTDQLVYGCSHANNLDPTAGNTPRRGCEVSRAMRSFTAVRYQLNYGPMVFDGEAAMQRGSAVPTGPNPSRTHITYKGDAQVVRAKWKQRLYKTGEGIARASLARGSGDKPDTGTTDEAFFPTRGHRVSGLERSGFGEFFAATPYDAFGGSYNPAAGTTSSTTISGLREGRSGIMVVGVGYTPPAWRGWALDVDYYLFQADRVSSGPRTLGMEWDVRLRYQIQETFSFSLTTAIFKTGTATNLNRNTARKYALEASGRF